MTEVTPFEFGRVVSPALKAVVPKLTDLFGPALRVTAFDTEWLTFQVSGLTSWCVFQTLQSKQNGIFGPDMGNYRILCPAVPRGSDGVSIHDVSDLRRRHEHTPPGFWFY